MRLPEQVPATEAAIVSSLLASYADADYSRLTEIYLETINTEKVPDHLVQHYKTYKLAALNRGKQFANMFLKRLSAHFAISDTNVALELGCGSGAGMVALANSFAHVVGLDPGLPNLILAHKLCEESEITSVQFVCAYGQEMPFADNSFDYVSAQNVLEHVFDADAVMIEIVRILNQKGCFVGDSRNRFDLFFPEPHVNLRWVGMLPRSWAAPYIRWRLDTAYNHTYLLSYWNLRKALHKGFGTQWQIVFPSTVTYGGKHGIDRILYALEKIPLIAKPLLWIFPSHLALAQKSVAQKPVSGEVI